MSFKQSKKPQQFIPILMCGGLGLRVWPMSRNSMPKQFIKCIQSPNHNLTNTNTTNVATNANNAKISTFQQSIIRLFTLLKMANHSQGGQIIIVTNQQFLFHVRHQTQEILQIIAATNTPNITIILEPEAKNTMPTVLLGCVAAQKMGYNRVFVCTGDHLITSEKDFAEDIIAANNAYNESANDESGNNGDKVNCAESGESIVIFGSKPKNETDAYNKTQKPRFGKIIAEAKPSNFGQASLQKVITFSEKAAANISQNASASKAGTADEFINCGLILSDIDAIFNQISRIQRQQTKATVTATAANTQNDANNNANQVLVAQNCIANAAQGLHNNTAELTINAEDFAGFNAISADYSLLNNADNLMVFPAKFIWRDLGSWMENVELQNTNTNATQSAENTSANTAQNATQNEIITHNASNCLIKNDASGVSVVANDVKDLTIYCSSDFVFVSSRADAENAYANLKSHNTELAKKITQKAGTEYRQWGYFDIISSIDGYKVKKLTVMPQRKTSLQSHNYRSEYWLVSGGSAQIILGDEAKTVPQMGTVSVSVGQKHQIINNSKMQNLTIIEVQKGEILAEEDIIRYKE